MQTGIEPKQSRKQSGPTGPNVLFLTSFEGKLPVFKNRNVSKTKQKKEKRDHAADVDTKLIGVCCSG